MAINNLLKSAVRKHALANGIRTSGWSDDQIAEYAAANNVSERDNLKKAVELGEKPAQKPVTERPKKADAGSVEDAIKALVESVGTKADMDEDRVIELIKQHGRVEVEHVVHVKTESAPTVTRKSVHKDYAKVLAFIAAGVNVCAVGPAGSGKSTIFEHAAEDLGKTYYFQGAVQQEHKILGFIDANGVYQRTQFRDAYEHGGLFVMEEFDGSAARALLAINNAVAGNWCDFPDGKIEKHPDFVCVMAGNTFGLGASRQYVGRSQLDAATLDRFAFIEIGYDEVLERDIATSIFEGAGPWVSRVQNFRAKVEKAGIRHVVSPRASIGGAKLLKHGVDEQSAIEAFLHKGLSADQLAQLS